MSNFTNNTQTNFTIIQNDILNNSKLSFDLKGLYCFLISKPSGWSFSADRITTQTNDKIGKVKRMLRELEDIGLLTRTRFKSSDGKFEGVAYEIHSTMSCISTGGKSTVPISNVSNTPNISNTNNSNTNNSNIDNSITSEIKISDNPPLKNLVINSDTPIEINITKQFFDLFRNNQIDQGVTTFTKYDTTKLNSWLTHVDKLIRIDKVSIQDIRMVYGWLREPNLKNSEFWRKNILSTAKLREQFPKLQIAMREDLIFMQRLRDREEKKKQQSALLPKMHL